MAKRNLTEEADSFLARQRAAGTFNLWTSIGDLQTHLGIGQRAASALVRRWATRYGAKQNPTGRRTWTSGTRPGNGPGD